MAIEFTLENFLLVKQVAKNDIPLKYYNELVAVEKALQFKLEKRKILKKELEENEINIVSISKDVNISRKSFYNKPLLKDLVEWCINEFDGKLSGGNKSNISLYHLIEDLKEKLKISVTKEVQYINRENRIKALESDLEVVNRKLQSKTMQLDSAETEIRTLRKKLMTHNVIK